MVLEKKDSFLESKIQTPTASRNFLVREQLIQRLNAELREKGYITISGRVSRSYFEEKLCYGGKK